jgi:hypothetical protein
MKNVTLSFALFFIVFTSFSQEEKATKNNVDATNEININIAYLLAGIPEVGYEYIINEESGVGMDIMFAIDSSIDFRFALTPYYRLYFGKKKAAGFFAEGFGMVNTIDSYDDDDYYYNSDSDYYYSYDYGNQTDFALGAAVGGKFITNNDFVFEVYGGLGRNLFSNTSQDFVPRFGLTFGKRF